MSLYLYRCKCGGLEVSESGLCSTTSHFGGCLGLAGGLRTRHYVDTACRVDTPKALRRPQFEGKEAEALAQYLLTH